MKAEVKSVTDKTKNIENKPRVLIYDSGEGEAFVGDQGYLIILLNLLVEKISIKI